VSGFTPNTDYQFMVVAMNAIGPSLDSVPSNTIRFVRPDAPIGVSAVAGNESALVSWTPPANDGGFAITSYTIVSSGQGYPSVDVSGSVTEIPITGLMNGDSYTFTVLATNKAGTSDPSDPSAAVIPVALPGPPTQVTATFDSVVSPGSIFVSWTAPADDGGSSITGYEVSDGSGFTVSVSPSTLTVDVSGLVMPAIYSFGVVARNANGPSVPSAPSAPILFGPPTAPLHVTVVPEDGQALVRWDLPLTDGGFPILYYTISDVNEIVIQSVFGPTLTSATSTGLTTGVVYSFKVLAGNSQFASAWSSPSLSVPVAAPFTAPTNVIAVPGVELVHVSWTPPTSNGGYTIDYYLINTHSGGVTVVPGSVTTATITGLVNGVSYYFTVVAVTAKAEMESLPSNIAIPATAPLAPQNVTATRGNVQAVVSWTAPNNGGSPIIGYTVASSPSGFSADVSGSITSVTATGLTNGIAYTFSVVARNTTGSSAAGYSNSVTPATVPYAPASVSATRGNRQATVIWSMPANGGSSITSYTVTSNPDGVIAISAGSAATTVTGLTNGTAYTFTVIATNDVGNSAVSVASNAVTPATVPDPPIGLTGLGGDGQIQFGWSDPYINGGSPITSYTITTNPGNIQIESVTRYVTLYALTNGTTYTSTVVAWNNVGLSGASTAVTVVPARVPSAPTVISLSNPVLTGPATYSYSDVVVTWNTPNSGGAAITNYYVYPHLVGGGTGNYTDVSYFTPDGNGNVSTTVHNLNLGSSYQFSVVAKNSVGLSNQSALSTIVTIPNVPDAPLSASTSYIPSMAPGNTINITTGYLEWQVPSNTNGSAITAYTIHVYKNGVFERNFNSPTIVPYLVLAGDKYFIKITLSDLSQNTTYTYTVDATNAVGASAPSVLSNPIETAGVFPTPNKNEISFVSFFGTISAKITLPNFAYYYNDQTLNYRLYVSHIGVTLYKVAANSTATVQSTADVPVIDVESGNYDHPGLTQKTLIEIPNIPGRYGVSIVYYNSAGTSAPSDMATYTVT